MLTAHSKGMVLLDGILSHGPRVQARLWSMCWALQNIGTCALGVIRPILYSTSASPSSPLPRLPSFTFGGLPQAL